MKVQILINGNSIYTILENVERAKENGQFYTFVLKSGEAVLYPIRDIQVIRFLNESTN